MNHNEPRLSLSTLLEISNILGFPLGRNNLIRDNQQVELVQNLQLKTSCSIEKVQEACFYFGTLDFIPYKEQDKIRFKFLEFSGTGSGGTSNLSYFAFNQIIDSFQDVPTFIKADSPLILLAYTDSQSLESSFPRKFVFERFLYAHAMKTAFIQKFGQAEIIFLLDILKKKTFDPSIPTIVIGYLKDFIPHISLKEGKCTFLEIPVDAILNDTLCNNVHKLFDSKLQHDSFYAINEIFNLSADKELAYRFYNEFRHSFESEFFEKEIDIALAQTEEELVHKVYSDIQNGKKVVIKPYAGSVGMGVEFFTEPTSREKTVDQVRKAIQKIEAFQGIKNWGFPYLITPYVDSMTIEKYDHQFYQHKYDLRVIVYRQGNALLAFPSVVRIAESPYNPDALTRNMMISYASLEDATITKPKQEYLLPFSNKETLHSLAITENQLLELCSFSTQYVKYALDSLCGQKKENFYGKNSDNTL